jgi:hypothetical protein
MIAIEQVLAAFTAVDAEFVFVGGNDTHTVTMDDGIPGNPEKS